MSDTYTKLFSSITESTVWGESYSTRIVWVTMLAMADAKGAVYGAVPGLARRANVTLQEVEQALAAFMAPDAYSRTKDEDGRRIEEIDGGWRLINHAKYSAVRNAEERREYKRKWDQENRPSGHARAKEADSSPAQSDRSPTNADESDRPDHTSTNTNTKKEQKPKQERAPKGFRLPPDWAPSPADIDFATRKRPDVDWQEEADKFRDYWHSRTGKDAIRDGWSGTWRNWIRRADGKPRAGPQTKRSPSNQLSAVANLLGVHTDDLASRPRPVVRHADSPLSGELVPAEPRRLPGGGCVGQSGNALGTPSLGKTSFGMD